MGWLRARQAHRAPHSRARPLTRRIKIVLVLVVVLVLDKWGCGAGVLEYWAKSKLHPCSGLGVL